MNEKVPEHTETQDDRDFRLFMGELECPACGELLAEEDIKQVGKNTIACERCGAVFTG